MCNAVDPGYPVRQTRSRARQWWPCTAPALLLGGILATPTWATPPTPIADGPGTAPVFIGAPAVPQRVLAPSPPRHPFMARNGRSNIHDDAYMTDTYRTPGPLGTNPERLTSALGGVCASVTFDRHGRLITLCVSVLARTLVLIDPDTLDTLATYSLPPAGSFGGFQDFSGGGYFYLDDRDRAIIPTTTHHIFVVALAHGASRTAFSLARDYDLTSVIPDTDKTTSCLPDWSGRIWFVTLHGVVGVVDPGSGAVQAISLGEDIENSFAVDETGGVFIVSDVALYRFDPDGSGAPTITWRELYPNSGIHKPGQVNAGSGTTPTLMGPDWVAIADNADPMDVVVYRRAKQVEGSRLVCAQAVFAPGASATENSLIGAGRAMIVENNYGYTSPADTSGGLSTQPGIARVDIDDEDGGCHLVWQSNERAPTVVPKLSRRTGLVYTYTKDPEPQGSAVDPWYLTAIDFRNGETRWKRLAGLGTTFNNNYAPVTLGPNHAAYVGVIGGIVRLADTP